MKSLKSKRLTPHYHGKSWVGAKLPRSHHDWTHSFAKSVAKETTTRADLAQTLSSLNKAKAWRFPKRKHFFFSDLHGDPDAFAASLVASGGVKKTGPNPTDFVLSREGQKANFVIGGDCFDKGPSSLGLLRSLYYLKTQGARLRILAGNHDVRVMFGMVSVGKDKQVRNEHFFIRTGQKIIPLLREVWEEYLKGQQGLKDIPSKKECRKLLYPRDSWFEEFPKYAKGHISKPQIAREMMRISKKTENFERICDEKGMNLRQVYAAVQKWKELFLQENGEFYWFYRRMRLGYRSGSFLFIHAGLDNEIAQRLSEEGMHALNRYFRKALYQDPFDFYYGPLCNTLRTKYRKVDFPFTRKGAQSVKRAGISALIHGHRNLYHGQRLALRNNVLNFECDTSLDRETRKKEGVRGRGASVTILEPSGKILGVSSDFPYVKVFDPQKTLQVLTQAQNKHVSHKRAHGAQKERKSS